LFHKTEVGDGSGDSVCDSDPCMNGGACNEDNDGYTCTCGARYTGDACENGM